MFLNRTARLHGCVAVLLMALAVLLTTATAASAQVGGSVSGTVKDQTGGVMPGVSVTATNTVNGNKVDTTTSGQGAFSFPKLPVGRYDLLFTLDGFKPLNRTGIAVDADSVLQENVTLELGEQSEVVTVTVNAVRVDTVSTQLGEVVSAPTMTTLSLNGRSYTDLLSIQPGVVPVTSLTSQSVIMAGVTGAVAPSGELNPGNVSVNGQRETSNGFFVNGSDVQERMNGGTAVVPNLDSIEEFRVLTSNFDPEYGNYNGGIVNVVTKSGSDIFHGNGFEFLRNSALDQRNYFSPEVAAFTQNQPGGTIGGPLIKKKLFFFVDYQYTGTTQGIETGLISVPSAAERSGNLAGIANQLTGTVNGSNWAGLLAQKLGYPVSPGEPYYTPGCVSSLQCVLPNAMIPQSAWSTPAQNLLQYIPDAQRQRQPVFDRRVSPNRDRQQGRAARRWEQPVRPADRLLLRGQLPTQQPLPHAARRRHRAGVQRAHGRPCATVVVQRLEGVQRQHGERLSRQLHLQREQHRHAQRRPRRQPPVAGVCHRARHAGDCPAGAAAGRRGEHCLQYVHHGGDHHGRESDRQHVRRQRQRHQGDRVALGQGRWAV